MFSRRVSFSNVNDNCDATTHKPKTQPASELFRFESDFDPEKEFYDGFEDIIGVTSSEFLEVLETEAEPELEPKADIDAEVEQTASKVSRRPYGKVIRLKEFSLVSIGSNLLRKVRTQGKKKTKQQRRKPLKESQPKTGVGFNGTSSDRTEFHVSQLYSVVDDKNQREKPVIQKKPKSSISQQDDLRETKSNRDYNEAQGVVEDHQFNGNKHPQYSQGLPRKSRKIRYMICEHHAGEEFQKQKQIAKAKAKANANSNSPVAHEKLQKTPTLYMSVSQEALAFMYQHSGEEQQMHKKEQNMRLRKEGAEVSESDIADLIGPSKSYKLEREKARTIAAAKDALKTRRENVSI